MIQFCKWQPLDILGILKDTQRHIKYFKSLFQQKWIQIGHRTISPTEAQAAALNERLTGRRGWEIRKLYVGKLAGYYNVTFLQGMVGVYPIGYPTGADPEIPD